MSSLPTCSQELYPFPTPPHSATKILQLPQKLSVDSDLREQGTCCDCCILSYPRI